ncbi:hypothetical protein ABZ297_45835, partial [Nonomuraea sp. NPDC005983]|uniref:peroxiredoxin family protein n=1 Tax=Nonomuraea sp. NPDC005983 TaxID=3155595 RepID=UPI0033B5DBD0
FGGADLVGARTLARTGLLLALAAMAAVAGPSAFTPVHLLLGALLLGLALLLPRAFKARTYGPRPGTRFAVRAPEPAGDRVLYALISPACGLCSAMLPAFAAASGRVDVVLVSAAEEDAVRAYLAGHAVTLPLVIDPEVFDRNGVPWPPYAVVTDGSGTVLAAGGTADPADLDALLTQAT